MIYENTGKTAIRIGEQCFAPGLQVEAESNPALARLVEIGRLRIVQPLNTKKNGIPPRSKNEQG